MLLGLVLGEDFYDLLKVDKDADTAAIKKAFRKMSLEYHPDKNPGKLQAPAVAAERDDRWHSKRTKQENQVFNEMSYRTGCR